MKEIIILGSTGSIGTQTLNVIRRHSDKFKVVGMSCGANVELFNRQIVEFKPAFVCVADKSKLNSLLLPNGVTLLNTMEELVSIPNGDIVVTAIVGLCGLAPTICAIKNRKNIALANKETLVACGSLVMGLARKMGVSINPVDSEHSAIWQCIDLHRKQSVKNLILTASGGAFRGKTLNELKSVTLKDALKHPTWDMGVKVTIDSASLMNKGLEVIEAMHLFDICAENIKVVVHKQSIIHSMVCYCDNSVIAQLSKPTMELPIQLALTYPERYFSDVEELNFAKLARLDFEDVDSDTFKCLSLAYKCANFGGLYPAILNSANESAVNAFISNKIKFLDISYYIECALNHIQSKNDYTQNDVLEIDKLTRDYIEGLIKKG